MQNIDTCVIIPVYKANQTKLHDLLLSLLIQTDYNFDIYLALDGDSKSNYEELTKYFAINILSFKENQGAGMTRQRALDKVKSKYKYVTFIDSDDLVSPIFIESLHRTIIKEDSDIAYSNILRQFEDRSMMIIDVNSPETKPITWMHGKMYKIDYLIKNKIKFKKDLRLNEDIYFNYIAFNLTKNIAKVQETTYYWLYNSNSTTAKDRLDLDYIKYNIRQSILCSNYCILDLAKKNKHKLDEKILAARLISIYSISQEALHYNIDLKEFKDLYLQLSKELDIINFVKNNQYYFTNLTQIAYDSSSKKYLYKQSFIQFIEEAYNNIKEVIEDAT